MCLCPGLRTAVPKAVAGALPVGRKETRVRCRPRSRPTCRVPRLCLNSLAWGAREVGAWVLLVFGFAAEVQSGEWGWDPVRSMLRPPWPLSHKPGGTGRPLAVSGPTPRP